MSDLARGEWVSGTLRFRRIRLPTPGTGIPPHTHCFDHTTMLMLGRARVDLGGGRSMELEAPASVFVEAEDEHAVTALSDNVEVWCVFPLRNREGALVETAAESWAGAD